MYKHVLFVLLLQSSVTVAQIITESILYSNRKMISKMKIIHQFDLSLKLKSSKSFVSIKMQFNIVVIQISICN